MSSPAVSTWTCYLCQSVNLYKYCSNSKPYCGLRNAKFPMNPPGDGSLPVEANIHCTACDQLVEQLRAAQGEVARVAKRVKKIAEISAVKTENRKRKWLASEAGQAAAPERARISALRQAKLEQDEIARVAKAAERLAKQLAKPVKAKAAKCKDVRKAP